MLSLLIQDTTSGFGSQPQYLKLGVLEEPRTLNIWLASDTWSSKVLYQIYQPLYIRDPQTLTLIPWLAKDEPVFDPDNLSYTVKLRPAKWSDGSELTSADVAFTGRLIRQFNVPRHASKWKFIEKIETPDKHTVVFYLKEPKAIFLTRTLTTPIVAAQEWRAVAEQAEKSDKPLMQLLNHTIESPLSSGPFVLKEWRQGAYLFLSPNPHFFGRGLRFDHLTIGPYINGMLFKLYGTSDAAIMALKKGSIDMFWWGIQPGYLKDLEDHPQIKIFSSDKSALYFLGFNLRKAPLDDIHLRQAIATVVDEDFIVKRILQDQGLKMHSIIPPGNTFWCCKEIECLGCGMSRNERIKAAYTILKNAGYRWEKPPVDQKGNIVKGHGIKQPNGEPMRDLTILTPPANYDPNRAMTGMMIQEWLRLLGMPAAVRPMSINALIQQVKVRHDFDLFVLGYGNLSLDPDYLRVFFLSSNNKSGGWNISGYNNPEFDQIADESSRTMDSAKRRELIFKMQHIILKDLPYLPLYDPKLVEAVRIDRFHGWVPMLNGIGNIWSFCTLKPVTD